VRAALASSGNFLRSFVLWKFNTSIIIAVNALPVAYIVVPNSIASAFHKYSTSSHLLLATLPEMTMMTTQRKSRMQPWFALAILPLIVSSFAPRSPFLVQPNVPLKHTSSSALFSFKADNSGNGRESLTTVDDDDEDASNVSSVLDDLSNKVSALQALAKEHQPTEEALEKHIEIIENTLMKVGQKVQQDFQAVNEKLATLEEEKAQQESKTQDAFKGLDQTLRAEMETMEVAYQNRCQELEIAMRQRVREVEEEIDNITWDQKLIDDLQCQ
jgi:hypothetical protein